MEMSAINKQTVDISLNDFIVRLLYSCFILIPFLDDYILGFFYVYTNSNLNSRDCGPLFWS